MIYLEGILNETVRVISLIFGDLIYIFLMILFIQCISNLINWIFFIKIKNLIYFNPENANISKKDYSKNIIKSLKEKEKENLYSRPIGKIIDMAKLINIIFIIYFVFNFNNKIFLILFILNMVSWIGVQIYLNIQVKNKLINNQ